MLTYVSRDPHSFHPPRIETVYRSGISPSDMQKVVDKNEWLEAALCAVFNELQRRGVIGSVIAEASRNGLIGIMDFWQRHQKSDEARIAKALHSFSKDEQEIIKKTLEHLTSFYTAK